MGPVSEQRLAQVHPKLASLIRQLNSIMSEPLGVTQGLRSSAVQTAYFAQGRQPLASVNTLRASVNLAPITEEDNQKPVTNAPAGYSWHEFGLAVDVVPMSIETGQPDWDEDHPVWKEIVVKGEGLGLASGIEWHDEPHFQLVGRFSTTPNDFVRATFAKSGIAAVWQQAEIPA